MADNWYVGKNGSKSGPFSPSQLRDMASRGDLLPTDMVWRQGLANWVQASAIKGLFAQQQAASMPPQPGPPTNPYAPPAIDELRFSAGPTGPSRDSLQYAEFMPRVAAALLDGLFLAVIGCVPGLAIMVALFMALGNEPDAAEAAGAIGQCCFQVVYQVVAAIYYVTLETSTKQGTWGKQIVGIKVADLQGNRITIGRAIGRYFAKIITGLTCGIGMIMPLFTEKKQTLHDMIAGCVALKK